MQNALRHQHTLSVPAVWANYGRPTPPSEPRREHSALPHQRKEPLTDANHVRDALARFDQVEGVSDEERDLAFTNIKKAAAHYGINVHETDWRELTIRN